MTWLRSRDWNELRRRLVVNLEKQPAHPLGFISDHHELITRAWWLVYERGTAFDHERQDLIAAGYAVHANKSSGTFTVYLITNRNKIPVYHMTASGDGSIYREKLVPQVLKSMRADMVLDDLARL